MEFNLLDLHDSKEDANVRKLLRVYSVIPRFSKESKCEKAEQAIRIVKFLRKTNEKLKKEISPSWKNEWIESTKYPFYGRNYVDWFIGRASIPLIALKKFERFDMKEEVENLISNCDFFCSTTGDVYKVPHIIDSDLAYLVGAILGDGHIKKHKGSISFEVSEEWLAKKFIEKVGKIFDHKLILGSRKDRGKVRCLVNFTNKSAVRLFNKIIGIPRGKKSHKIFVPEIIKKASSEIKSAFLEGVFDTDGGKRGKGYFGLTSASKQFRDDLVDLMELQNIKVFKDEWVNKLYNRSYYGFKISKKVNAPFVAGVR